MDINTSKRYLEKESEILLFPMTSLVPEGSNCILVQDTLVRLTNAYCWHRNKFNIPVIGITGSNGKTIIKEWLFQLLMPDYYVTRSPKSYNSQVGVPLSVWQLKDKSGIGIFEAGISEPDEMSKLTTYY